MTTLDTQAAPASTKSFEKYGIDWPQGTHDALIEMICYRDEHSVADGGLGKVTHLRNIVDILWPKVEQDYWFQTLAESWCHFGYLWLTGCASGGKTYGAGLFSFIDWLVDPTNAATILTSTTVPALRVRVYGEAKRFWRTATLPLPGNLVDSSCRIESTKGDDKHAVRGIAVKDGPLEKAIGNIQGVHASRVMVVIDEMPQTPRAISVAASNLSKGATYFRMCGIGNAVGKFDTHGKSCEPLLGWNSVSEDWAGWLTKDGICLHYDGLQSPNVYVNIGSPLLPIDSMYSVFQQVLGDTLRSLSSKLIDQETIGTIGKDQGKNSTRTTGSLGTNGGDAVGQEETFGDVYVKANNLGLTNDTRVKLLTLQDSLADAVNSQMIRTEYLKRLGEDVPYAHLIDAEQILKERNRNTEDSLEWWSYVRGFWAPEGITKTVFSTNLLVTCMRKVTWESSFRNVAFCDPAFEGGDRCVLGFGRIGIHATDNRMVLELTDRKEIKPNMRDPKPIHFQLADQIIDHLRRAGIQATNYAMDTTGEGGGLADILAQTWHMGFRRIEFGGSPSDSGVSASDGRRGTEAYSNRVTELWFDAKRYAQSGQIFGMDEELMNELCSREYTMEGKRYRVEKKEFTKNRLGCSPDLADAFVVGAQLLRQFGPPGDLKGAGGLGLKEAAKRVAMKNDVYSEANFTEGW